MAKDSRSKALSLIEVMAVVVIFGVLTAIASLSVTSSIDKAKRGVCFTNTQQLERHYEANLITDNMIPSYTTFLQYMKEYGEDICPENGVISYVDGEVHCSLHSRDEDRRKSNDDSELGVPYL